MTTGLISCGVCGAACPPGGEVTEKTIPLETPGGQLLREIQIPLTWCQPCAQRRAAALVLVEAHPALAARLGDQRALEAAEGLLIALAVLGSARAVIGPMDQLTDADLGLYIRRLAQLGIIVAWRTRVTGPAQSVPYPWGHVTDHDRARLRAGYAQALREKIARRAPATRLYPPSGQPTMPNVRDRGCLFCGLGAVAMPADQVSRLGGRQVAERTVWRPVGSVDPNSIGGPRSPLRVSGWLCPDCAQAVDSAGSFGQTALHKALIGYLDTAPDRSGDAQRVRNAGDGVRLVAWGVFGPPDSLANERPWQHLTLAAERATVAV